MASNKVEDNGGDQQSGFSLKGVGSVIAGVTDALDSIFGWSSKRQERSQQRLMDKQQDQWKEQQQILADQQLEQWNRENEYNDPTNYYERLFNAADTHGIKRSALIDGVQGSVGQSATGVSASGSTSTPGVGGVSQQSIGAGMNTMMQGLRQRAEIELLEAQARNLDQQSVESESRVDLNNANKDVALQTFENLKVEGVSEQIRQSGYVIANALAFFDLSVAGERHDMDMAKQWSEVQENYALAYKSYQEGKHQETVNKYAEQNCIVQLALARSQIGLNEWAQREKAALVDKYGHESTILEAKSKRIDEFVENELKVLKEEAKWSPIYQYSQSLGKLPLQARFQIEFLNPDFDPREYFTEKYKTSVEGDSVDARKNKLPDKNPIKK